MVALWNRARLDFCSALVGLGVSISYGGIGSSSSRSGGRAAAATAAAAATGKWPVSLAFTSPVARSTLRRAVAAVTSDAAMFTTSRSGPCETTQRIAPITQVSSSFRDDAAGVYHRFIQGDSRVVDGPPAPSRKEYQGITWKRDVGLDTWAATAIAHHQAMVQLESTMLESQPSNSDMSVLAGSSSINGNSDVPLLARDCGSSVIRLDFASNPLDDDARYSLGGSGPTVLSRFNTRSVVRQTVDLLQAKKSVFVIGQEGTGKTRSYLLGCLSALLSRGAPVMYVACKRKKAFLFLPQPVNGQSETVGGYSNYMAWVHPYFELYHSLHLAPGTHSRLLGDSRLIVLIDPPEHERYDWEFNARVVQVCANKLERHFLHAHLYQPDIHCLYTSMPRLAEIMAMAPVLWNDATSNLPGTTATHSATNVEIHNILAMRAFLVGCAPRYLFSFEQYRQRLYAIREAVETTISRSEHLRSHVEKDTGEPSAFIRNSQSLVLYPSTLYDLDGLDSSKAATDAATSPKASVTINGLAKALFYRDMVDGGKAIPDYRIDFESSYQPYFCPIELTLAPLFQSGTFVAPLSMSAADHATYVDAVYQVTTDRQVYDNLCSYLSHNTSM